MMERHRPLPCSEWPGRSSRERGTTQHTAGRPEETGLPSSDATNMALIDQTALEDGDTAVAPLGDKEQIACGAREVVMGAEAGATRSSSPAAWPLRRARHGVWVADGEGVG